MELAGILGVSVETAKAVAVILAAVAAGGSAVVAAYEYRLKARAERAETDTKLARLFADLVPVADGWRAPQLPDGLASALLEHGVLTKPDFDVGEDGRSAAGKMLRSCYVTAPSGAVTMVTALSAIAELGARHEILQQPAQDAIDGLGQHSTGPTKDAYMRAKDRVREGKKPK